MKRAIFCDIDGCLGPGKHIALDLENLARVRGQIVALAVRGIGFYLCTGRPQPYAEAMMQVLDLHSPFICENGAMVFNPEVDLATKMISDAELENLRKLRAALVPEGFIIEVGNEYSLSLSWGGIGASPQAEIARRRAALAARFSGFGLDWTNSHTSVDVTPKGVSKQSGVAYVLDKLGIPASAAMAIGDSHNDVGVLQFVGQPMCPDNAAPEIKVLCQTVAKQPRAAGMVELLAGVLTG